MARAKQAELPGVEKQGNAELDAALELYAEKRDLWVEARTEVQAAKAKLLELAKAAGLTIYRDDNAVPPLVMTLKEREATLKVTAVGAAAPVDDDEYSADDAMEEVAQ